MRLAEGLVEVRDLEPGLEGTVLIVLGQDDQRLPRLFEARHPAEQRDACPPGVDVAGLDRERAIDERKRAIPIALSLGHVGCLEQQAGAEPIVGRVADLRLERLGEPLVIAGSPRRPLQRHDRGASQRVEREDPLGDLQDLFGARELVLPDREDLQVQADLSFDVPLDGRGLLEEIDPLFGALRGGVVTPRAAAEQRRERVEDRAVARLEQPGRAQRVDRLLGLVQMARADVGGPHVRPDARRDGAVRVGFGQPRAHSVGVPAEALQRLIEGLPDRTARRVLGQRTRSGVRREVCAPEARVRVREADIFECDGFTASQEAEALDADLDEARVIVVELQLGDQLGEDARLGQRPVRSPLLGPRERGNRVGPRRDAIEADAGARVQEARCAIRVCLAFGLHAERLGEALIAVVPHEMAHERRADRSRVRRQRDGPLQGLSRGLDLLEVALEDLGALDAQPRREHRVTLGAVRGDGVDHLREVVGQLVEERLCALADAAAQEGLEAVQRSGVFGQQMERFFVGVASLLEAARVLEEPRAVGVQVGAELVALGDRDLVGEDVERLFQRLVGGRRRGAWRSRSDRPDAADAGQRWLECPHALARRFVVLLRTRAIEEDPLAE